MISDMLLNGASQGTINQGTKADNKKISIEYIVFSIKKETLLAHDNIELLNIEPSNFPLH